MGIVMGLFFMISGHFIISFAANIVMGIVADCVAKVGKYKSKKWIILSYVLFSYGLFGPVIPMWFMKDAYVANWWLVVKMQFILQSCLRTLTW